MKVAILGAGGWGTALAAILTEKHEQVALFARKPQLAATLRQQRENAQYLPGVVLPASLQVTEHLHLAVAGAAAVVVATPSHGVRDLCRHLADVLPANCVVISAVKGLESDTCLRMTEVIAQEIPAAAERLAVISGPNHAEEVGRGMPGATVAACRDRNLAEFVQDTFMLPFFRVYSSRDTVGVELGGALKNVVALAAGIAEGLGFGDNAKAALMTRGLAEIARLGAACQADIATFSGLSGVGDLIATCTSPHSRNRRAGIEIAKGRGIEQIQADSGMVVEGVRAASAAWKLARARGVEMPITDALCRVLHEGLPPHSAVMGLMTRGRKHETEDVAFPSAPGGGW